MKANHAVVTAVLVLLSLTFSCGGSDADLPTSVQMLSADYHEAYRLLPDGEWASQYYTLELDKFSKEEWETADDHTPTFIDSQSKTFKSDILFNLSKVIQDKDAEEWVVAKIHELVPSYGDKFEDSDLTSERIKLLKEIVAQGTVHQSILDVEIYYRWALLTTSDHPPEKVQLFVRNQRQFFETRQAFVRLSQRDSMIRETELRLCDFAMWDVVGVDNTLDVIANGECDVQKVIELAMASTAEVPTERDYKERVVEAK
ncbi:MAG: hypothetical protein OXD46_04220 [Chloroflexi bacterium]|nr:hypothetical protein [Chloroflexota bacterium]